MTHARRHTVFNGPVGPAQTCPVCGKQSYLSRKAAKQAAQRIHPGRRMRAYKCDGELGEWHLTSQSATATEKFKDWRSRPEGER